nr:transframe fusion protein [Ndumu virus]
EQYEPTPWWVWAPAALVLLCGLRKCLCLTFLSDTRPGQPTDPGLRAHGCDVESGGSTLQGPDQQARICAHDSANRSAPV